MIKNHKNLIPRPVLLLLANLLLFGLIVGSFLPSQQKIRLGTQQTGKANAAAVSVQHRLYHFASFSLTTGAFLLLARGPISEAASAILMFSLGCLIEIAQCLLAKIHLLEWWDIRDDFYAVVGAFLLIKLANALSGLGPTYKVKKPST